MGVRGDHIECSIDWLSVTWPDLPGVYDHVLTLFGGKGKWIQVGGIQGYDMGVARGEIRVFSSGNGTIFANLKGEGCRQLAEERAIRTEADWQDLLHQIAESGGRATRIDVAFDYHSKLVEFKTIHRKALLGHYTSQFRKPWTSTGKPTRSDKQKAATVVFGSEKSERRVVIYDKALETGTDGPWIRIEMQARKATARALMLSFLEEGFGAVAKDIRARIAFRVPPRGTPCDHQELWGVCRWWEQMVGTQGAVFRPVQVKAPESISEDRLKQFRALLVSEYERAGEEGLYSLWVRCAMLADDSVRKSVIGYRPQSRGGKWNRVVQLYRARRTAEQEDGTVVSS